MSVDSSAVFTFVGYHMCADSAATLSLSIIFQLKPSRIGSHLPRASSSMRTICSFCSDSLYSSSPSCFILRSSVVQTQSIVESRTHASMIARAPLPCFVLVALCMGYAAVGDPNWLLVLTGLLPPLSAYQIHPNRGDED